MTINTVLNTPLPGFNFCYNDPSNPTNGRAVLVLASLGLPGTVVPTIGQPGFGTPPGAIPAVGTPQPLPNARADGLDVSTVAAAQLGNLINNRWLPLVSNGTANIGAQTN